MKKVLAFFICFLWLMGVVGGFGYCAYYGAYPIAVGVLVTGWLSFKEVKALFFTWFYEG